MFGIRFWYEFRGPARLWAASIVFTALGPALAFELPSRVPELVRDPLGAVALQVLGWTFLLLGLLVLLPMLVTLYIRKQDREREAVWHWWINFIGGLAGALVFAVPATLTLPLMLLAYSTRPNLLFPAEVAPAHNLWLAGLFSVTGAASLALTVFIARHKLREDPRLGV
jgi:hypothetical protein